MKKIERVMMIFSDENGRKVDLEKKYFGMSKFIEYTLNKYYSDKKINFLNFHFRNFEYYKSFPNADENLLRWEYGLAEAAINIDYAIFDKLIYKEQKKFLWSMIENALKQISLLKTAKFNEKLIDNLISSGIKSDFIFDIPLLECTEAGYQYQVLAVFDPKLQAKIRVIRLLDGSSLERELFPVSFGEEYFIDMFKKMEVFDDSIIIDGKRDSKMFPITIKKSDFTYNP